jgi:HAD superfamily hydrolase (TIGR01509 family)
MIKAIIFDCFGVLTTDAWLPFKDQHFGHDPLLLEQASDLNKQSDGGFISYDSFLTQIAALAQVPSQQVAQAIATNVPNQELFEYVSQLKPRYKLGLLSNAPGDWLAHLFTPSQVALFDVTALSYETHFTKPMPEAYATIAERLGVEMSECIFTDDQERFVTGAREAGMPAIWYKDNDQLKAELTALLADPEA